MEPKEHERVPQPPPGPERALFLLLQSQGLAAQATLGALASQNAKSV